MNKSKLTRFGLVIFVLILSMYLFSCGCGQKLAEKAVEQGMEKAMEEYNKEMEKQKDTAATEINENDNLTGEEKEKLVGTGKMSDDKLVEIMAYDQYLSKQLEKQKIDGLEFQKLREAKLKKLGVNNQDYINYISEVSSKDVKHYAELVKKAEAQAKKLMNE